MDLHTIQIIYYTLGSIFFGVMLLIIIAAIIAFFVIKRKLNKILTPINEKIAQVKDIYDHKEKYILKFFTKGSSRLIKKITNIFRKE